MNKMIIANAFNKYFVSIAQKLNNNDEPTIEPLPDFRSFLSKHVSRSIVLEDTSSFEIEEIIKEFANGKASDLPVTAVKHCADCRHSCTSFSIILQLFYEGRNISRHPQNW